MNEIGITERGDAALDHGWLPWVKNSKPAILITKDPYMLYQQIQTMPKYRFNTIIHATITGLGSTLFEPNVPSRETSLMGYEKLASIFPIERIVLRIDPIIPTEEGVRIAQSVLAHKINHGRVRISFIDQYLHVRRHLKVAGISLPWSTFHAPLKIRQKAYEELSQPEICGEPDFACTGCVSEIDCKTLNVIPDKDKGIQRKFCACLINKKELLKNKEPCGHNCLYCYWDKK
jgi:DNA repair photolyase